MTLVCRRVVFPRNRPLQPLLVSAPTEAELELIYEATVVQETLERAKRRRRQARRGPTQRQYAEKTRLIRLRATLIREHWLNKRMPA